MKKNTVCENTEQLVDDHFKRTGEPKDWTLSMAVYHDDTGMTLDQLKHQIAAEEYELQQRENALTGG